MHAAAGGNLPTRRGDRDRVSICRPLRPAPAGSVPAMMAPHQPALPVAVEKAPQDLEQAWMELLSIPELQQCLNMPMADVLEPSFGAVSAPTVLQDPNYNFYMPALTDMVAPTADPVCPSGYLGTFEENLSSTIPPDNLNQMTLKPLDLNASFNSDSFCEMFYPGLMNTKVDGNAPPASSGSTDLPLAELHNTTLLKPMDIPKFALGDEFESRKPEATAEFRIRIRACRWTRAPTPALLKSPFRETAPLGTATRRWRRWTATPAAWTRSPTSPRCSRRPSSVTAVKHPLRVPPSLGKRRSSTRRQSRRRAAATPSPPSPRTSTRSAPSPASRETSSGPRPSRSPSPST
ncbi:hypothetical protein ANANG_G00064300 [Anguilla anguilla]|uniref:Uncharacterized protein n=1 Tax=Anguilla anguilla TaxID=7936 RepID=A0A9D3MPC1_ANGAN|nr:hypothetical protein ANANG_G00064300 [Anguilla anguilla]